MTTGRHVTADQLERLRNGTLPPQEVAEAGRHATACETCGPAVRDAVSLSRRLRDLRLALAEDDVEHLSDDDLMACADGTMRDDAHLQACAQCRGEVEDLVRLRRAIHPPLRWRFVAAAAAIVAIVLLPVMWMRRPRDPVMPPRATTTTVSPAPRPVPVARGYGRAEWDQWVREATERRRLSVSPILLDLRPPRSTVRGASADDDLGLEPNGTVVATTHPRFRWRARGAATYKLILQGDGGGIVESGTLTEPRWTPPRELKHGREYAWQVEVTAGGARTIYPKTPAPAARFRVADRRALDEIDAARRQHPRDALLQAVILARYGLRDDALGALDELRKTDAALAEALRNSLTEPPF